MQQIQDGFTIRTISTPDIQSPLPSRYWQSDDTKLLLSPYNNADPGEQHYIELAGPRPKIAYSPPHTRAAIVTCGGLCPGLNDVIRGVVMVLWHRYGVRSIMGIRYGYSGMRLQSKHPMQALTPDIVEDIHVDGGTILGTSRGRQSMEEMCAFLQHHNIDLLFTIGGDGTQSGALELSKMLRKRGQNTSVVGIPKTIDNDILFTDETFGFATAVSIAQNVISGVHMEAKALDNGIGLVKLMGRDSGFIAAAATLASSDVNLVLVPEIQFSLEKLKMFFKQRFSNKNHAVIVVAEGARPTDISSKDIQEPFDIGLWLKDQIPATLQEVGIASSLKYIDPSYIIRSAPANAYDSSYCFQLAASAAHAAMAGKTELIVSRLHNHFVHIPMHQATTHRKKIDPAATFWRSVLDNTGQPDYLG